MTLADEKQLELMRAATRQQRSQLALRLSDQVIALSRRAIDRAYPELDATARKLKFIELQYGETLARRLSAWLRSRHVDE